MRPDVLVSLQATLAEATEAATTLGLGRATALGWATVDLDRGTTDLADALGLGADRFADGTGSVGLGARSRVALDALGAGLALAILEPSTEGRLAAILARHGEGPAAFWFATDDPSAVDATTAEAGPFGPERVIRAGPPDRRSWFLVVAGAGTIDA